MTLNNCVIKIVRSEYIYKHKAINNNNEISFIIYVVIAALLKLLVKGEEAYKEINRKLIGWLIN